MGLKALNKEIRITQKVMKLRGKALMMYALGITKVIVDKYGVTEAEIDEMIKVSQQQADKLKR